MIEQLVNLFLIFFKIGFFTFGGGYVAISILQQEMVDMGYMSVHDTINMVAIAQMTPGSFAVNAATFAGFRLYGFAGGLVSAVGMVLPSVIICLIVARFFFRMNEKPVVRSALRGLRPAVGALIFSVLLTFVQETMITAESALLLDWPVLVIAAVSLVVLLKSKVNPAFIILGSGAIGALFLR